MPGVGSPVGSSVSPEDVGDLQLWALQRPRALLHPSISQLRQQLVGAVSVADQFGGDMGVLCRGAELCVTQQNLDNAHICPCLKQVGRKAVAQRVQRAARLLNPRQMLGRAEGTVQLAR